MSIGLVGHKRGMTRVFTEDGRSIPVTVVEVQPNRVVQVKTKDNDGYPAVQVTYGKERRQSLVNKPTAGHYKRANTAAGAGLCEFRIDETELAHYIQASAPNADDTPADTATLGSALTVNLFNEGQFVDVTGTSKGKGFAGVIKRHNFHMQDATHGNSLSHRAHGSIGQCQTPGRVFKGKKMAGQMGNKQKTSQNLSIVSIDAERNLLLIKGAVPGAPNGRVVIKPAVKKINKKGDK